MRYSPESTCTLTGDELNKFLDDIKSYVTEINSLKETVEDNLAKLKQQDSELVYLEQELDKARFNHKKHLALNKVLLKNYSTNKITQLELDGVRRDSTVCQANFLSIQEENHQLKQELKLALQAIPQSVDQLV